MNETSSEPDFPKRSIVQALFVAYELLYEHRLSAHLGRFPILPEDVRWILELVFDASMCQLQAHHPLDAETIYAFDMSKQTDKTVVEIAGGPRQWLLALFLMSIASHYANYAEEMSGSSDTYARVLSDGNCTLIVTCKDLFFDPPQEI